MAKRTKDANEADDASKLVVVAIRSTVEERELYHSAATALYGRQSLNRWVNEVLTKAAKVVLKK